MSNPYTTQAISGYNSSPPPDDGTEVSTNEITWANHKTKLGDPLKTLAEAINTETLAAFGLTFGQTISTHATDYTVLAADRGKFLSVTGTTTITLLAVATAGDGFPLAIVNTGTGVVTVDGSGAETINGSTTIELSPGESLLLTCNGSLWIGSAIGRDSSKGADIASATTTDIGAATGNFVDVTGTTTITGLGTVKAGTKRTVQFDGSLTLTYNATSLILPGNANIITNAGDIAEFISLGSGNWLCSNYIYRIKPSFSVHRNGTAQSSITGANKIEWTTEEFDTNNNFDITTNYRFTPTVAGKYLLSATIQWANTVSGDILWLYLYKNGAEYKQDRHIVSDATHSQSITVIADANGTTDYFEIYAENFNRDTSDLSGNSINTYWTGSKID